MLLEWHEVKLTAVNLIEASSLLVGNDSLPANYAAADLNTMWSVPWRTVYIHCVQTVGLRNTKTFTVAIFTHNYSSDKFSLVNLVYLR